MKFGTVRKIRLTRRNLPVLISASASDEKKPSNEMRKDRHTVGQTETNRKSKRKEIAERRIRIRRRKEIEKKERKKGREKKKQSPPSLYFVPISVFILQPIAMIKIKGRRASVCLSVLEIRAFYSMKIGFYSINTFSKDLNESTRKHHSHRRGETLFEFSVFESPQHLKWRGDNVNFESIPTIYP